jgi:hypothetical protein
MQGCENSNICISLFGAAINNSYNMANESQAVSDRQ